MVISCKEYGELLEASIKLKRTIFRVQECRVSHCAILNGKCPLFAKYMNSHYE